MKRVLLSLSAVSFLSANLFADDISDLKAQIKVLMEKVNKLEMQQALTKKKIQRNSKKISKVNILANNDNLKFSVDFRTAYDYINYKSAKGDSSNNDVLTNRLWLKMAYEATNNLYFYGTLSYYKLYGQTKPAMPGFDQMDWIVNEAADDSDNFRVKEAYFLYKNDTFLGMDIPWTASIGRRPSTDGLLVNYREDQAAKSAIGHDINMEFDGASFKYTLENITDIPGMSIKFCLGRGMSSANNRYSGITQNPNGTYKISNSNDYVKTSGFTDTNLIGALFNPYDDGQYSVHTVWFYADNLPGMRDTGNHTDYNFKQLGSMTGGDIAFVADGIGDGISDMLDDSVAFISWAYSKTNPKNNTPMLGSTDDKFGSSIYVGANWPCQLIDDARVGIEYNHGSKYWRSMTYGEDTLIGSKLAARGDAYEAWFNKNLIGRKLTAQIRYTYINYKYTGSNAFFGDLGTPNKISASNTPNAIDKAQDIRVYLRYRY